MQRSFPCHPYNHQSYRPPLVIVSSQIGLQFACIFLSREDEIGMEVGCSLTKAGDLMRGVAVMISIDHFLKNFEAKPFGRGTK